MRRCVAPTWLLGLMIAMGISLVPVRGTAAGMLPGAPVITDQILATISTNEITISGQDLGLPTSARELRLQSVEGMLVIPASSAQITSWTPASIQLIVPPEARTGTLRVAVDGQASNAVDLFVYEYSNTDIPGTIGHPLHLDTGVGGRLWIAEEFQLQLKTLIPDETPYFVLNPLPQAPGAGIFASLDGASDIRTRISALGEDIEVLPDGSVWFAQGGAYTYRGQNWNTSRIIRFEPISQVSNCYLAARDNAEVTSFIVDAGRGMVWYTEAELEDGNAISGFYLNEAQSNCYFDPATGQRPPLCAVQLVAGCHVRFPLPNPLSGPMQMTLDASGDIWFSEYWANRIARLDPETGVFTELPLPATRSHVGPGAIGGASPHNLLFDPAGDLWLTEEHDATIDRVRPSLMATNDCTVLDAMGNNPCVEEVFVGTNGFDSKNIHSLDIGNDGFIWFTYNSQTSTVLANDVGLNRPAPQIGFVATNHGDTVVLLPPLDGVAFNSGIVQDPSSGDVWFGEYYERRIGRLKATGEDADSVPASVDNCPITHNPDQANADGDFISQAPTYSVDDWTWINSDDAGDACDDDDDNDGLSDAAERNTPPCPSGTFPTDPLARDTDGDRVLDGVECALGADPASSADTPPLTACGPPGDADGDRISDRAETCVYGSSPSTVDTDADGLRDGCEVASINEDRNVNSGDQLLLAQEFIRIRNGSDPLWNFDLNKDGNLNSGDQLFMATFAKPGGCT